MSNNLDLHVNEDCHDIRSLVPEEFLLMVVWQYLETFEKKQRLLVKFLMNLVFCVFVFVCFGK